MWRRRVHHVDPVHAFTLLRKYLPAGCPWITWSGGYSTQLSAARGPLVRLHDHDTGARRRTTVWDPQPGFSHRPSLHTRCKAWQNAPSLRLCFLGHMIDIRKSYAVPYQNLACLISLQVQHQDSLKQLQEPPKRLR